MADVSLPLIATIVATFFLAGIVKGVTGMGLPTVAMGVMGAVLSPVTAAGLLLVPSFVTNIWQLFGGARTGALLRRLWAMMLGIVVGTVAGSAMLARVDGDRTVGALGAALALYAAYTLFARARAVPERWEPWLSPAVGLATGLVTGATGVFVIPAVPYIQSLRLERDDMVQALGLSFTISTVALAIGLYWHGAAAFGNLLASTLAVLPALLGMAAGQRLRKRIRPPLFRRIFLAFLLLLGAEMIGRAWF